MNSELVVDETLLSCISGACLSRDHLVCVHFKSLASLCFNVSVSCNYLCTNIHSDINAFRSLVKYWLRRGHSELLPTPGCSSSDSPSSQSAHFESLQQLPSTCLSTGYRLAIGLTCCCNMMPWLQKCKRLIAQ